jgi:hypothetical protein
LRVYFGLTTCFKIAKIGLSETAVMDMLAQGISSKQSSEK